MKSGKRPGNSGEFVVLQTVASLNTHKPVCVVFPAGDVFPQIYVKKFGPASKAACEQWIKDNCRATGRGGTAPTVAPEELSEKVIAGALRALDARALANPEFKFPPIFLGIVYLPSTIRQEIEE